MPLDGLKLCVLGVGVFRGCSGGVPGVFRGCSGSVLDGAQNWPIKKNKKSRAETREKKIKTGGRLCRRFAIQFGRKYTFFPLFFLCTISRFFSVPPLFNFAFSRSSLGVRSRVFPLFALCSLACFSSLRPHFVLHFFGLFSGYKYTRFPSFPRASNIILCKNNLRPCTALFRAVFRI